ncbi:MAG: SRPBCC family protein [Acidimicrobiales bacterium]
MDRTISTTAPATPPKVYPIVADLSTYEHWLSLIHRVEVAESNGDGLAWWVTLRAKVGPFARSKRLRMVRVVDDAPTLVRFERRELDGKDHSAWIMQAAVTDGHESDHSTIDVTLNYDGDLWSGVLDTILGGAIDSAIGGLHTYVANNT